jgi:hypothetical protein
MFIDGQALASFPQCAIVALRHRFRILGAPPRA